MRVRRCIWLPVLVLLIACAVVLLAIAKFQRAMVGPPHEFALDDRPAFLYEQLALDKARETLALDGFDPAAWQAHPDGRTAAPDGRQDEYFSRNTINSNMGSVLFQGPGNRVRFVSVELAGDRVICQSSRGK
jgi:hypothetical protein